MDEPSIEPMLRTIFVPFFRCCSFHPTAPACGSDVKGLIKSIGVRPCEKATEASSSLEHFNISQGDKYFTTTTTTTGKKRRKDYHMLGTKNTNHGNRKHLREQRTPIREDKGPREGKAPIWEQKTPNPLRSQHASLRPIHPPSVGTRTRTSAAAHVYHV